MTTSPLRIRRLLLTGGFVLAIAAAPALIATPSTVHPPHLLACDTGEEQDPYSDACVPHTVPNSPTGNSPTGNPDLSEVDGAPQVEPNPPAIGTPPGNPDIPEINGVPCTGRNSGECIGLEENQPDYVPPSSSVGSSPTIHGVEGRPGG